MLDLRNEGLQEGVRNERGDCKIVFLSAERLDTVGLCGFPNGGVLQIDVYQIDKVPISRLTSS